MPCPTEDDPLGACGQIRCQASVCALAICVCLFVAPAWGAGEAPTTAVLGGGLLVICALAGNEWLALRSGARG